ncbi:hypothetical protein TNCV_3775911 [Trichonephila clavipes]|nr:hypothetical protein TNCV_3775911 [Trichonephila clavipes]
MSFVFGPQELQLLHTVPSIFDENLFSFLDEREPMDLTMPRLNSCVKNIGPIQPMHLSVNSSIGIETFAAYRNRDPYFASYRNRDPKHNVGQVSNVNRDPKHNVGQASNGNPKLNGGPTYTSCRRGFKWEP